MPRKNTESEKPNTPKAKTKPKAKNDKRKKPMKEEADLAQVKEDVASPVPKRRKVAKEENAAQHKKTKSKNTTTRAKKRDAPTRASKVAEPSVEDIKSDSEVDTKPRGSFSSQGKFVGAHVSISGGLYKAVEEAVELGAKSFAMFLKSQRQWNSKPLQDADADRFKEACKEHNFSPYHIVPHGSYLMNCGSPKADILQKSRDMLADELQRCEKLGLALFNFHPGSSCGEISVEECIDLIADSINLALDKTKYVIAVIENMSCQGNTIGGKLEELRAIIDKVKDKSRIGVCLDTCHAFAAGFDISKKEGYEKFMSDFDKIVGLNYLKALHINDSKGAVGCHLDRHENIGKGKIGMEGFKLLMNDSRLNGLPLVLETPEGDYAREIKKLNSLCMGKN